jgi:hypothetical protein
MRARMAVAALALGVLGLMGPAAAAGYAADGGTPACNPNEPNCHPSVVNAAVLSAHGAQGVLADGPGGGPPCPPSGCPSGSGPALSAHGGVLAGATDDSFPAEDIN